MSKKAGNFAAEEKILQNQGFLVQRGQNYGNILEMLHQKRENPVKNPRIFGAVGPKMWKKNGKFALGEGNSCEKPRILGVMGGKT